MPCAPPRFSNWGKEIAMRCGRQEAAARWGRWLLGGMCVALSLGGDAVRAADQETRDFRVYVDGRPARGGVQMVIQRQDDGTVQMSCSTRITVKVLFVTYNYTYNGRETWKNGRLQQFASSGDDGKRFEITAVAEENGLRVRANGQEHLARPESWVTSYWSLPDPKLRDQVVPLIDGDTGRDLACRIQHIGTVQMPVAGQVQNVNHYRLSGKVAVDVWYDTSERLVRQEWVEEGHRTVLELARIRR
jgi:hypothetical protein